LAFTLKAKYVNDFSDGLALINDQISIKYPDSIKYIDKTGKIVIAVKGAMGGQFCQGLARICVTDSLGDHHGRCGFIDKSGSWAIEPNLWSADDFSDSLAVVIYKNGKKGYVDREGKVIIPARYDQAYGFHEGIAMARIADVSYDRFRFHQPGWHYINKAGELLGDTMKFLAYAGFSEGLAAVYSNRKFGFVNSKMEMVIPPEFTHVGGSIMNSRLVRGFHGGLCPASKESIGGRIGCIDTTGQFVIEPVFDAIEPFSGPLTRAKKLDSDSTLQCGYIDRKGEWLFIDDYEYPPPIP
jgi:hypothetical protein